MINKILNKKEVSGQGTIEYLVIVAIVIVIALVTIGILLQLLGQGSGIGKTGSEIAWMSAQPFGITDWQLKDGNLILILQNNSSKTLDLKEVRIGEGTDWNIGKNGIQSGAKTNQTEVIIKGTGISAKSQYAFRKENIFIIYNSPDISNQIQAGVADIIGTSN
ncbi:MAG: hypothetical protein PHX27_03335 [Candidatus ainarchaeum sp.]|nr:hypothetical protein [Candidatus ainarchaeum sp.]